MSVRGKSAEDAFADFHVFAAIEAICEGRVVRTKAGIAAMDRIQRICREQAGKQLRDFDIRKGQS